MRKHYADAYEAWDRWAATNIDRRRDYKLARDLQAKRLLSNMAPAFRTETARSRPLQCRRSNRRHSSLRRRRQLRPPTQSAHLTPSLGRRRQDTIPEHEFARFLKDMGASHPVNTVRPSVGGPRSDFGRERAAATRSIAGQRSQETARKRDSLSSLAARRLRGRPIR